MSKCGRSMYTSTQVSATPRGFVVASLYLAPVRTKLVRLFYSAYTSDEIQGTPELAALESVFLTNVSSPDSHPVTLMEKHITCGTVNLSSAESQFVYSLLCYTPCSEETKSNRLNIREWAVERMRTCVTAQVCKVMLACPSEGLVETPVFLQSICGILSQGITQIDLITESIFPLIGKVLNAASEVDFLSLQRHSFNIFLLLADLLTTTDNETPAVFGMRAKVLSLLSTGVGLSPDPLALLNLRQGQADKTVSQRVFCVLFEELMYEQSVRTHGLSQNYAGFASMRAKRIRDGGAILARLGSLHYDSPSTNKVTPLDEYSLFIPSLFGLVKALMARPSSETEEIDSVIADLLTGDLAFVKELSNPKIVGTCFELEQSGW